MSLESATARLTLSEACNTDIHFAVIGAGAAGLSCAIALGRIGYKVTLIEKNENVWDVESGRGVRMPPNMTKILYHWGLKDKLRAISVKSEAIHVLLGDTGEHMGTQVWDDEILRKLAESTSSPMSLSDLMHLLYDEAILCGADIRLGTAALSIDAVNGTITTDSAGVLEADVIIAADGITGLGRRVLLEEEGVREPADRQTMWHYSATIPKQRLLDDPALVSLCDDRPTLFCWLGDGRAVYGFLIGDDFALSAYGPYHGQNTLAEGVEETLGYFEPRVKNLLPLLSSLKRQPVVASQSSENWASSHGRLLLIGSAVRAIPPGAIQETAMAIEDGAIIARLFKHLRTRSQIPQFLNAFQEIRQKRCAAVTESERNVMAFVCLPPGPERAARDGMLREKRNAGVEVFHAVEEQEETPEWRKVKEVFGYEAEDAGDDWWVTWGSLRMRAEGCEMDVEEVMRTVN
ncbi:hypothetical protein FB45DRAFT_1079069 [Roridomyces roridus]|uniref:FAD-binding domain-containing protein n=1 Tax=Roridomyces roridus TaxID=1738132 RepID=A0AAD7CLM2_9AGAR|nr:hypothetical protein FB45DRAFT_1079069 [Roridomyces roridus]